MSISLILYVYMVIWYSIQYRISQIKEQYTIGFCSLSNMTTAVIDVRVAQFNITV
jgi:hypothetical protein